MINILKRYKQYRFKEALLSHNLRDIEKYQTKLPMPVLNYIPLVNINRMIDVFTICLKQMNVNDIISIDHAENLFSTYRIKNFDIVSAVINFYPDIWNKKQKIHFMELYFRDVYIDSSGLNAVFVDKAVVFDDLIEKLDVFYQQHSIENELMSITGYTISNQYRHYTILDFIAYLHINKIGDSNGHFINDQHILLLLNNGFRFSIDAFYQQYEHLLDDNLNRVAGIARTCSLNNIDYLNLILNHDLEQKITIYDIAISLD